MLYTLKVSCLRCYYEEIIVIVGACCYCNACSGGISSDGRKYSCNLDKVFKMPDDSYVTIIGNIVKQVGKEKYLVKSGNSTIVVEIDDELLWNIDVTPKNQVKITGEVERDFRSVELDASKIEIIK